MKDSDGYLVRKAFTEEITCEMGPHAGEEICAKEERHKKATFRVSKS